MDALGWLKLQIEWGADEALADDPIDRRSSLAMPDAPPPPPATPAIVQPLPVIKPAGPVRVPPVAGPGGVADAQALAQAATTIAELQAAVAAFEGCALCATATNMVFGEGDHSAHLVLIGDVPGAAEDRAGTPFAGPAGLFLDRMLVSAGLDRGGWRSTSLLPWRPPGDRKPTEAEIRLCLPFLHRHLQLLRPVRAVLLGNLAARTLLSGGTRRPRGVWHMMVVPGIDAPIPTLALPSPGHIQVTASAKRDAWADLLRLRRALSE
jgi:uracil-DNA glycosylase family 4